MHFMWAMVIGFIAGTLVNRLRPGHDRKHMLVDFGVGIGVALVAGVIGRVIGFRAANGHPGAGLFISVGLMWVLLFVTALVVSRRPDESLTPPPDDRLTT